MCGCPEVDKFHDHDSQYHLKRDTYTKAEVSALLAAIPDPYIVGEMRPYLGAVAPTGWMLCTGELLLQDDYPELFAILGTSIEYGPYDPDTEFFIPDTRGRVIMGATVGGSYPLLSEGGSATHTLTIDQIPAHTHGISDEAKAQPWASGATTIFRANGVDTRQSTAKGGGQPHNNLQPYFAANWIIRVSP